MTNDCASVESVDQEASVARLCGLLAEQVACGRQGRIAQVERLAAQVDGVIAGMTHCQESLPVMTDSQRRRVRRLYDELVLTLQADQADVQTKLRQLRQVKRIVGACKRNEGPRPG